MSPGDLVYTQQLFGCDIHDKVKLGRILMLGSRYETIAGRPLIPEASVDAVIEVHPPSAVMCMVPQISRKKTAD